MRDVLTICAGLFFVATTGPVSAANPSQLLTPSAHVAANASSSPPAITNATKHEKESNERKDDDEEYEDLNAEKAKPVDPRTGSMLALAKQSGCLACQKLERKLVGPAWSDVAQRYNNEPNSRSKLVEKISHEDIETLVNFMLSLPPQ
jgi:cytochrome c551/c552